MTWSMLHGGVRLLEVIGGVGGGVGAESIRERLNHACSVWRAFTPPTCTSLMRMAIQLNEDIPGQGEAELEARGTEAVVADKSAANARGDRIPMWDVQRRRRGRGERGARECENRPRPPSSLIRVRSPSPSSPSLSSQCFFCLCLISFRSARVGVRTCS